MAATKITKFREAFAREAEERARLYELTYHGCAECALMAIQELVGIDDRLTLKIAGCLTGGLGRTGRTCGALLGGIMALGLKYGRNDLEEGMEGLRQGQRATYDLVNWFEGEFGSTDCRGLTGCDFTVKRLPPNLLPGRSSRRYASTLWPEPPAAWPRCGMRHPKAGNELPLRAINPQRGQRNRY